MLIMYSLQVLSLACLYASVQVIDVRGMQLSLACVVSHVNWVTWGDAVGSAGLLGRCQKAYSCNKAHVHAKTAGINCKPVLCFLVISSWGIVNLTKQKCEHTLKWIFHQFLSWLEATVTGKGHFTALSHTGHSCCSPLPRPCSYALEHICELEAALTTITSTRSLSFHKSTKLLHASQHCCPSVGHLLATVPLGCPCPSVCLP